MLLLAAATLDSGLATINVRPAAATPASGTFNVRDFGAVGDATTDDTAAFQAAIDNATAAARDLPFEGFSLQSRAELFIPRGHYRLTRTLTLPRLAPDLRGESRPVLRMDDAAQDIIFGSAVWRWQATGLHLAGGKNQLHVGNNNTDRGQILIADCTFTASAGAAIRLLEPSRELQPPRVGKLAAHRGAPTHELRLFGGSFSTHVAIRDVVFEECVQALVNWADWTTLDNAWITTARAMPNDTAVIENHDRLFATNVLGVPHEERGPGSQQRWCAARALRRNSRRQFSAALLGAVARSRAAAAATGSTTTRIARAAAPSWRAPSASAARATGWAGSGTSRRSRATSCGRRTRTSTCASASRTTRRRCRRTRASSRAAR